MDVTKTVRYAATMINLGDRGDSLRLLLLNQESYSHGAQFVASAVDGTDYL